MTTHFYPHVPSRHYWDYCYWPQRNLILTPQNDFQDIDDDRFSSMARQRPLARTSQSVMNDDKKFQVHLDESFENRKKRFPYRENTKKRQLNSDWRMKRSFRSRTMNLWKELSQ